jgi:hypothetical protein
LGSKDWKKGWLAGGLFQHLVELAINRVTMPRFVDVSLFIRFLLSSILTVAQAPPEADTGSPVNKVPSLNGSLE